VFVSPAGSDSNDCSNVATPCRTFVQAIFEVDDNGEVIVVATGSFGGISLTTSKNVRINAPPGVTAFVASTVTVDGGLDGPQRVVLRGLTIKALTPGTGNGIFVRSTTKVFVENCVIDGWQTGVFVFGDGFGIITSPHVFLRDTIVRNNSGGGLNAIGITESIFHGSATASVERSLFEHNGGCGVRAARQGHIVVRDSVTAGNDEGFCVESGFVADVPPDSNFAGTLSIVSSVASNNTDAGIQVVRHPQAGSGTLLPATLRVSGSHVTDNGIGFSAETGTEILSAGNNLVRGNGVDVSGMVTLFPLQ
jgi:hypothetical protein